MALHELHIQQHTHTHTHKMVDGKPMKRNTNVITYFVICDNLVTLDYHKLQTPTPTNNPFLSVCLSLSLSLFTFFIIFPFICVCPFFTMISQTVFFTHFFGLAFFYTNFTNFTDFTDYTDK